MPSQATTRITIAEYLALERQATGKSEYFNGEVYAIPVAHPYHHLITLNIGGVLRAQLTQRRCAVYMSDMRLKVSQTGLYTYPDVVVVCAEPAFEDAEVDTLLNPTVLVEVLSHSTAAYDRGKKFEHYRTLESLQEYLLVDPERCHVVHYIRQTAQTWRREEMTNLYGFLLLPSIDCDLSLAEMYARVPLER
jgi:Uma2 family endonuclease